MSRKLACALPFSLWEKNHSRGWTKEAALEAFNGGGWFNTNRLDEYRLCQDLPRAWLKEAQAAFYQGVKKAKC